MINPSALGWIDKFLSQNNNAIFPLKSWEDVYFDIQQTGFIYGHVISLQAPKTTILKNWTVDEATKIALLNALYLVFVQQTNTTTTDVFLEKTIQFYKKSVPQNTFFFSEWFKAEKNSSKLEGILDARIQTNSNFISKNFSHIVTNALLFIDVLAFQYFLENDDLADNFFKKIEENCLYIVSKALQTKTEKTTYDDLLLKLFKNSLRFTSFSDKKNAETEFDWKPFGTILEKYYYIDLAEMALWNDAVLEPSENDFLMRLVENLGLEEQKFKKNHSNIGEFIKKYKNEIPYFKFSNPVKHFYDNTTQNVSKLILRNKKRLIQEVSESKELMVLLTQSTTRKLDETEKKKVKKQLLDICKTIPSLTIFLLPGGGLLLPILIKFIPQLLPSSFNENLD